MTKKIEFVIPYDLPLEEYLKQEYPSLGEYRVLHRSLDARNAPRGRKPKIFYKILKIEDHVLERDSFSQVELREKPLIVGAGPAGLFCALRLKEYGVRSTVFERGERALDRMKKIARYWRYGDFDPESNVCFGEGGAGLFSDGKLLTRVKSPLVQYVLQKLVDYGAPEHILYESNPHLGSNKIRSLIGKITDDLESFGSKVQYSKKVDKLLFDEKTVKGLVLSGGEEILSSKIILATGHSAKELYHHLHSKKVPMQEKDFALGVRVEHSREYINEVQFGEFAEDELLGAARYRVSYYDKEKNRGTYSFCMCPGGYVLSSGTDSKGLVTNGMSNYAHNSPWSNSAIVVTVKSGRDFEGGTLGGIKFIESIEEKAFNLSEKYSNGRSLPAMTMEEFLHGELNSNDLPATSCPSKVFKVNLTQILPIAVIEQIRAAIQKIDKKMKGFYHPKALIIAPETRTSAPVTILRDENLESVEIKGLYPCGEGAGYAGGITSAAIDGVRVADSIVQSVR